MLVISDTKRIIKNVNELIIVPSSEVWDIKAIDSIVALGTYGTLERAKKVLDEFVEAYKQNFLLINCSKKLTEEEFKKYSQNIIFRFPER